MENPFSKKEIGVDKPQTVVSSMMNDQTRRLVDFLKTKGIDCTTDEIETLNGLDKESGLKWVKEKVYGENLEKINSDLVHTLDEADVFKTVKDPMEIKPEELESMMSFKTDEEQKAELSEVLSKARTQIKRTVISKFINDRNKRRSDGKLDDFLSIDELRLIDREVENELKNAQRGRSGVRDADKLSGVKNTLNAMSVESRYSYEGYKEGVCNDFGITPESFDEWMGAVISDNMKKLDTDGINIRTDLYKVKEFQIKHKGLLKKVPGWKKGDIVYISEFNKRVREIEDQEIKDAEKNATPEGKQLFKEMVEDTFHSPDNPVKLKKGLVSENETKMFLRKRASRKKPVAVKVEEQVETTKPENKSEQTVDLNNFISSSNTPIVESIQEPIVSEEPKEPKEVIAEEDPYIEKYLQMGLSREQAEILAKNDRDKESVPEIDPNIQKFIDKGLSQEQAEFLVRHSKRDLPVSEEENTEEITDNSSKTSPEPHIDEVETIVVEEPVKVPEPRYNGSKGVLEDYTKVQVFEADPSLLRGTSNRLDAIRKYKDSAKRGRLLFLPNSNYEVYIKKIRSTESIGYMITLLNNMKDMNLVDAYVKSEVLRVLYENIEFDFQEPVSYDDFVRCLHESDMTILMLMMALVNIPENKDGKIPLTIKSVLCSNPECGAVGNLKEEITLDLKEEFMRIYPTELYATNYANYKKANYQTIYHAYRSSEVGKMERFVTKDDMFEYDCICSAPTVYKTQALKAAREEVTYKRLLERIDERIDLFKTSNDIFVEIKDYMETHTYHEYAKDLSSAAMDENNEIDTRTKTMLTTIGDELETIKKEDLPFYLVMDTIDQLSITTLDGEEVVTKLDQKDVYTLIGILAKDAPRPLLDKIIEVKNSSLDKSFPLDIEFTAEELAGRFDFDGYYGSDEEMVEEIERRYEHAGVSEEDLKKVIEAQRAIRNDAKPKYEKDAICICGNDKWKLNYTAILFFWTSNLSQTLLK